MGLKIEFDKETLLPLVRMVAAEMMERVEVERAKFDGRLAFTEPLILERRYLYRLIGDTAAISVWLFLVDCAKEGDGWCYPSQTWLAEKTGLDLKTVRRAIAKLEDVKLLRSEKRGRGYHYWVTHHAAPLRLDTAPAGEQEAGNDSSAS